MDEIVARLQDKYLSWYTQKVAINSVINWSGMYPKV